MVTAKRIALGQFPRALESGWVMTFTILDPCTGSRVSVSVPYKPRPKQQARRQVLRDLERLEPRTGEPGSAGSMRSNPCRNWDVASRAGTGWTER